MGPEGTSGPIHLGALNVPISHSITIRDMILYPDFINGQLPDKNGGKCGAVLTEGGDNQLIISYKIETFSARELTWNLILNNGSYSYTAPITFGPESFLKSADSGQDYRNIGGTFRQTVRLSIPSYLGKGMCGIFISSPFIKETKIADIRLSSYAEAAIHWLGCFRSVGPETLDTIAAYFSSATWEEGKAGLKTLIETLSEFKNRSADSRISYDWGRIFFLDKRYSPAENLLRGAADANPQNGEYQYWAGRIFEQLGNAEKASFYYSRALSFSPESLDLIRRLKKIFGDTHNLGSLRDLESKYACAGENAVFLEDFENPSALVSSANMNPHPDSWVVDSRYMNAYVDSKFRYEGERSLRVDMNEVDTIYHTRRHIAVKPHTRYRLIYFLKAQNMKRKLGIAPYSGGFRVMIRNSNALVWGKNVEQDIPWTGFASDFSTQENLFIEIVLWRFGSSKKDDYLWGSVWLDNLCLIEE